MIDRPKKKGLQKLVAHQSESEWALPQDHDRHLLKFPQGELIILQWVHIALTSLSTL